MKAFTLSGNIFMILIIIAFIFIAAKVVKTGKHLVIGIALILAFIFFILPRLF